MYGAWRWGLGRWRRWSSRVVNGVNALIKRDTRELTNRLMKELSPRLRHVNRQGQSGHLQTRKQAFTSTWSPSTLLSDVPAFTTVRHKPLVFKPCGLCCFCHRSLNWRRHLLYAQEFTKIAIDYFQMVANGILRMYIKLKMGAIKSLWN